MRGYGEVRVVRTGAQAAAEIARDLVAMLLSIGLMVRVLFLAGGM